MPQTGTTKLPLDGIRVLDATHIVAGPFCSMILADMGAEVIKIERPISGELARKNAPYVTNQKGESVSARFLSVNRNKKSLAIDLRDSICKKAFTNLLKETDILLDNWGPGSFARLGFDYDTLQHINPKIIYATITGYGNLPSDSPYGAWPANNLNAQAMGGWMETTGDPDRAPKQVGDNIGDSVPGVWTALAIVLALQSRHQTGKGQFVDMAMYDCMAAHMVSAMSHFEATGEITSRGGENVVNAQLTLKTSDGYVVLAGAGPSTGGEQKFKDLWNLLGRSDLMNDPRYLGIDIKGDFYFSNILPEIEIWSQHKTRTEVTTELTELGFSMGIVQNAKDLYDCPQLLSRNMFADISDTIGGTFRTIGNPINLQGCDKPSSNGPPILGLNTSEILSSIGQLTESEISHLKANNLIS
ncbi:MAG: CaiB/BaiF CoA transferase family protein [Dehalococcoidia bacterium]|tara:strand:+ start:31292 stop:32536 length:1245 start_codon:yes stop_codon:yes gene_type:complete